jgi:hypothetical protein
LRFIQNDHWAWSLFTAALGRRKRLAIEESDLNPRPYTDCYSIGCFQGSVVIWDEGELDLEVSDRHMILTFSGSKMSDGMVRRMRWYPEQVDPTEDVDGLKQGQFPRLEGSTEWILMAAGNG